MKLQNQFAYSVNSIQFFVNVDLLPLIKMSSL